MGLSDIFERLDRLTGWSQPQQSSRAITPADFGSGADLYRMSTARKSLEQWFIDVMGDGQRPG